MELFKNYYKMEEAMLTNYCSSRSDVANLITEYLPYYVNLTGHLSFVLAVYIGTAIYMSDLMKMSGYKSVMYYVFTIGARRTVPFFMRNVWLLMKEEIQEYIYKATNYTTTKANFVESVLSVMEGESLALMCVERFSNAHQEARNGRVNEMLNKLLVHLSIMYGLFYSAPMLWGFSANLQQYDYMTCDLDLYLGDSYDKHLTGVLFVMKVIKPQMVCISYLSRTLAIEAKTPNTRRSNTRELTQAVLRVVIVHIISVFPTLNYYAFNILSQILGYDANPPRNSYIVIVSSVLYSADGILGMLILLVMDKTLYKSTLEMRQRLAAYFRF
ncbi:hypothetical protein ACJJTC_011989 [Scirpophaga incertulas]